MVEQCGKGLDCGNGRGSEWQSCLEDWKAGAPIFTFQQPPITTAVPVNSCLHTNRNSQPIIVLPLLSALPFHSLLCMSLAGLSDLFLFTQLLIWSVFFEDYCNTEVVGLLHLQVELFILTIFFYKWFLLLNIYDKNGALSLYSHCHYFWLEMDKGDSLRALPTESSITQYNFLGSCSSPHFSAQMLVSKWSQLTYFTCMCSWKEWKLLSLWQIWFVLGSSAHPQK